MMYCVSEKRPPSGPFIVSVSGPHSMSTSSARALSTWSVPVAGALLLREALETGSA